MSIFFIYVIELDDHKKIDFMNYYYSIAEQKRFKDFTVMTSLVLFDVYSLVQATRKNNISEAKRHIFLNFLIFLIFLKKTY